MIDPLHPSDAELSVQLRLFQKAAGIKVTGILGPQTVAALNTDATRRSIDGACVAISACASPFPVIPLRVLTIRPR